MADPTRRLRRMLEVLPRLYTRQPSDSAVGLVLRRAASQLAALDVAQRRVMYDHWVALADGSPPGPEAPSSLERLGALLEIPRLAAEPTEAYRARLGITARILLGGLATPRAILTLALADLGTEACPRMETSLAPRGGMNEPWTVEATAAWGVPPGTRRRCPVCAGTATGPCPNRQTRLVDAWLAENPTTEISRSFAAAYWVPFPVESRSLVVDRPVLRLRAIGDARLSYPAVQNRATGEVTLFAGVLQPGETLILEPAILPAECQRFDDFEGFEHHAWAATHPRGRATISRPDGGYRDVSGSVFFLGGSRFNDLDVTFAGAPPIDGAVREDGTRFAVLEQSVRTPQLRPGADPWQVLQFARPESRFDDAEDPPAFAGPDDTEGTRFAQWDRAVGDADAGRARMLFQALATAEAAARAASPGPAVATLDIAWLTRPPATFRVVVMRSAQVDLAEARGGLALLRRDLDMARPAGVLALLDIRRPPMPREDAGAKERSLALVAAPAWREAAPAAEGVLSFGIDGTLRDSHDTGDGLLAWHGVFDITRLDATQLG